MYPTLKKLQADPHVIRLQSLLSANGYFVESSPAYGLFDEETDSAVRLFQAQHVDKKGKALSVDGQVGKNTWWALENASGHNQQNHFISIIPKKITSKRKQLLELVLEEHKKPVYENPDGSNRSEDIDEYWGETGLIGYAWCCAFVSWALNESLGHYPIENKHHVGVQAMWRAAKRLEFGSQLPKPGDIFIQLFARGKGHTGFVLGLSKDEKLIYTVEGNCGNRLKVGQRKLDSIHHYIDVFQDEQANDFERIKLDVKNLEQQNTR